MFEVHLAEAIVVNQKQRNASDIPGNNNQHFPWLDFGDIDNTAVIEQCVPLADNRTITETQELDHSGILCRIMPQIGQYHFCVHTRPSLGHRGIAE